MRWLFIERLAGRILNAAYGVLDLAGSLFGGTLGFGFRIAGYFTDDLLDGAFGLMSGAFDAVFVHNQNPLIVIADYQGL
jgi:hypothetical protein